LKQTALYLDRQIIDDPLFRLSAEPGEMSQAMSDYLGISTTRVDRAEIAAAVRFLKELTPMYVCGYVRILPLSNQFEPPAAIPLTISATQYRELLPPEVLRWIRYHALIAPVEVREGQMHVFKPSKQPPPPRRMIHIQFDPSDPSQGQGFNLLRQRIDSFDRRTGHGRFSMTIPDTAPGKVEYQAWIEQSINQAAAAIHNRRMFEAGIAGYLGASYITESSFVFDLLREIHGVEVAPHDRSVRELLRMDLPILKQISIRTLMKVRQEEGEAFANFRSELDRQLRDLDLITDPGLRRRKVANIARELSEDQVRAVQQEVKSVRRKLAVNAVVASAGLVGAFLTVGATAVAAATIAAGGTGVVAWLDAQDAPRKLPGYFLWSAVSRSSRSR
jgi:hypothetical protein